jgi:predicted enzyme related to lactoylglutathione lyase
MGSKAVPSDWVEAEDWAAITENIAQCLSWIRKARGEVLYTGVEHVGLYPTNDVSAQDISEWYVERFGFDTRESPTSFFLSSNGPGGLDIVKGEPEHSCHVAIRVSDFEAAVEDLEAKGVELLEPMIDPGRKRVYFKHPDPAGNLVHLLWLG